MGSPAPAPVASNLTALLQGASTAGNPTLIRCPSQTLARLRKLNEAEYVILFTPVVPPHPETDLPEKMDPFEPLGKAIPPNIRHVPYLLDNGMTPTHADFLPTGGAVVVVICVTQNILECNANAFHPQLKFARDVASRIVADAELVDVPLVLLLVTNGPAKQMHLNSVQNFPALVTLDDYSTAALSNAARTIFGQ
jgi:hypothetical protein